MCGSFPWDMCIIFTGISFFTPSHPVYHLYMFAIHQLWFPRFLPHLSQATSIQLPKEKEIMWGKFFLNASSSCMQGTWWIWERVWLLAQMTQCNYETNWKLFPWKRKRERETEMCFYELFLSFSLSFSLFLFFFFFFAVSRLYFRLTIRNEVVLHRLAL